MEIKKASDIAFELYKLALEDMNWTVILPNGCPIVDIIPHFDKKVIELLNWELVVEREKP